MNLNLICFNIRPQSNFRIGLLIGIIALLNFSCDYEFKEDSFYDVPDPEINANIEVEDFQDGIVLMSSNVFTYKFEGNGKHILKEVVFYLDNESYYRKIAYWASFPINIEELEEGEHTLKLEYTFSYDSGSLAGYYGDEFQTNIKEYTFTVER